MSLLALKNSGWLRHQLSGVPVLLIAGSLLIVAFNGSESKINSGASDSAIIRSDTTLHEAVISGNTSQVRRMIEAGANLNVTDDIGWTPLDHARKRNRQEIRRLLLSHNARTFQKVIPDMYEGPHLRFLTADSIELFYLRHDSKANKSSIEKERYSVNDIPIKYGGLLFEHRDLEYISASQPPEAIFNSAGKIFVVGDIHGEFSRVRNLLYSSGIIDKEGKWAWGENQLVFIGDIFDRGREVTEAFWMIYMLEKQAADAGGRVHLILGNHEPMIFKDDLRYITDEYYALCDNLGTSYTELFNNETLLGRWLRSKPVIISINDFGFVHAGISDEILDMKLPIDSINKIVWQFHNSLEEERNVAKRSTLLGSNGTLWYRGYINNVKKSDGAEERLVDRVLEFYGIKSLIIGHTEVDSITPFYGGKIIDVNIPKRIAGIPEQGLLIIGDKMWVVYEDSALNRIIN
jgi:hypothetical protein